MMKEALKHLEARRATVTGFTYEVIVVDDGSSDSTSELALQYTEKHGSDKIRVLTLARNRGKGGAIRMVSPSSEKMKRSMIWNGKEELLTINF